jgi:hypothetical protein
MGSPSPLCIPPIVVMQRLRKHVPAAMNANITEMLEASFSLWSAHDCAVDNR